MTTTTGGRATSFVVARFNFDCSFVAITGVFYHKIRKRTTKKLSREPNVDPRRDDALLICFPKLKFSEFPVGRFFDLRENTLGGLQKRLRRITGSVSIQ